jgi:hypothetical protein
LYDFEYKQINTQIIFLNNNIDGLVYVNIPLGWAKTYILVNLVEIIYKLLKGLYRLKQLLWFWQTKLAESLKTLGFEPLAINEYIYFNNKTWLLVITYINDFLIFRSDIKAIDELKINLYAKFYIENIGPVAFFLGVRITRDKKAKTIILC